MSSLSEEITAAQVSLSNLPERTVAVDNTVLDMVTASSALSAPLTGVTFAEAMSYRDSNGGYRLRFNLTYTFSSSVISRFAFTGVVLVANQAITTSDGASSAPQASFTENTANALASFVNASTTAYVSGDIALASKPSWFDANREAGFSVAAQIEDASDTTSGLLNFYKTETVSLSTSGSYTGGNVRCTRIGNLVTITSDVSLTHGSLSHPASASGVIPATYRPTTAEVNNVYLATSSIICRVGVTSAGLLDTQYHTETLASSPQTSTVGAVSISYVIY